MLTLLIPFIFLLYTRLSPKKEMLYWVGLMFTVWGLGFFLGLSFWIALVVLAVAVPLRIYWSERHWGKVEWRALILAIPFLLTASMPTRFLDAGTYYNQAARWFEVGVPLGIGNFSLFLMQSSIAHSNEALINAFLGVGQNEVTALLSVFLLATAISRSKHIYWEKIIVAGLLFTILVHFTQSANADLLLMALLVFFYWARPYDERHPTELLALMVVMPFIKPVGIALSALVFVEWVAKKKYRGWWVIPLSAALYVLKRIWVSGRVPVFQDVQLPFAIPDAALDYLAYRNNFYNYPGRDMLPFNADLLVLLVYIPLLYLHLKRVMSGQKWAFAVLHLGIVLYWAVAFPAARYLFPFILLMLIYAEGFRVRLSPWVFWMACVVLGTTSVVLPWHTYSSSPRIQRFFDYGGWSNIHWITPAPLWKPETTPLLLDNDFVLNLPTGISKCYDAAFPCNSYGVHYYGGDSVFYPVYDREQHRFTYRAEQINESTDSLLDARSSEPYLRRPNVTP